MAQDPNAEQPQNDGNDDDNKQLKSADILAIRKQWEQIKKSLDAVMPIVDQVIRLEAAGNKPNKTKNMKKKKKKQLKDFTTKLNKLPKDDQHVAAGMEIANKLSDDLNAEQLANFNFDIRRFTQSIVKIRRELMQKYKKVKKEEEDGNPSNKAEDGNDDDQ